MYNDLIKEYYEKNKEWLRELSVSGEPIIKAIALAILRKGGSAEFEQPKKV